MSDKKLPLIMYNPSALTTVPALREALFNTNATMLELVASINRANHMIDQLSRLQARIVDAHVDGDRERLATELDRLMEFIGFSPEPEPTNPAVH